MDLYWPILFAGACCLCAGALFLRARVELWIPAVGCGDGPPCRLAVDPLAVETAPVSAD